MSLKLARMMRDEKTLTNLENLAMIEVYVVIVRSLY